MSNRVVYSYHWAWRNRLLIRTIFSCVFIAMLMVIFRGLEYALNEPSVFIVWSFVIVVYNMSEIPRERKVVRNVIIKGNEIKIVRYNNEETVFKLGDISCISKVDRKHGFGGYPVEQLLVSVNEKGDFKIPVNINNFEKMCQQLNVDNFKSLEVSY